MAKGKGSADVALGVISSLFNAERTLREQDLSSRQFVERRRAQVQPVLEKLHGWLEERRDQVPASTALGKAIGSTLGQWAKLVRYLESPLLGPDNNACERAI